MPTRVSRKKDKTAEVVRTSSNINRTAGARGVLHSHSLSILLHMTRAWPAHVGHLAARWNLDCRLPVLHHQHLSELIL